MSAPEKFTSTHLADHVDGVSHDGVNDFLHQKRLMQRQLWALVKDRLDDGPQAFLMALVFQLCSALYERVAVIVTTNLPFTKGTQLFHDETPTATLLDRLTYRAQIMEFSGAESFRSYRRTTPNALNYPAAQPN